MTKAIINRWDGGHAQDIRTHSTNEAEEIKNFDIFTNEHYLLPYPNTTTEIVTSGTITDHKMSDVIDNITLSGDSYIGLGQAGDSDANLKFFSKSGATDAWTKRAEDTSGVVVNGTLVGYKGFAYALKGQGSDIQLLELTNATTINSRGTVTGQTTACKPFVHPEDNILYGGAGHVIWRWDGTTFTSYDTIFPTGTIITSLTDYGTYLVVAIRTLEGKAIAYLWGRDGTINTTQGIINFGKGNLNTIENLGETIVGVVTPNFTTTINDKILIKTWAGGEVRTVKEITVGTLGSANSILKAKSKDKLYFIIGSNDCIYSIGKNKNDEWVVLKDRYVDNGTAPSSVRGLSVIDDYMWIGYINGSGSNVFYRTSESNYTSTATYKTSINPNMYIEDRYEDKQLDGIYLAYTGASSGSVIVKYSIDGSSMTTIISQSNTTGEKIVHAQAESDGKPFLSGREFQFQIEATGGAKIKELGYYYTKTKSK